MVDGGWWMVDGGWWMVDGGWWMVDGGWWMLSTKASACPCETGFLSLAHTLSVFEEVLGMI